jgi:hypothetical protein
MHFDAVGWEPSTETTAGIRPPLELEEYVMVQADYVGL